MVELALYHPSGGFYEGGGRAGRGGADFITSPEVGPLFGAVLARALDSWWVALGSPDPFLVVEAGAGTGTLAAAILSAGLPAAMRYVAVERSAALRAVAADRLAGRADVVGDLPPGPFDGVVLANELLDNLPFRLLQRTGDTSGRQDDQIRHQFADPHRTGDTSGRQDDQFRHPFGWADPQRTGDTSGRQDDQFRHPFGWADSHPSDTSGRQDDEIRHQFARTLATGDTSGRQDDQIRHRLGWAEVFVDGNLAEVLLPAESSEAEADRLAPNAPAGARIPLQGQAHHWVADAVGRLRRGRVVVVDYADTTPSMAGRPWTEWVRTYRGHGRAGHPLDALGSADITCEVAVDQLPPPTSDRSQADFLRAHGIDDLASAARVEWQARAHIGDLRALRARSRATEAAAVTDPSGLGAFRVLEWEVPG